MRLCRFFTCLFLCLSVATAAGILNVTEVNAADSDFESQIASFPDSYKPYLRKIHESYPNYTFVMDTVSDSYDTVVSNECERKQVSSNAAISWRGLFSSNYNWDTGEFTFRDGGYTYASYEVIAYYMDPRNFLNTDEMFMFVKQTRTGTETEDGVRTIIKGTFMEKTYTPNSSDSDDVKYGGDYAKVIMAAGEASGVSPYVIAATIIQEQGTNGTSDLISGTYSGYTGYYNFFNYNASGSTTADVIKNGLAYAKTKGWTSIYKSIAGGAALYYDGYLSQNQDTYYYKDLNVLNGKDNYWHQYAGAIADHYNNGIILSRILKSDTTANLTLRIPVYSSMSDSAYEEPAESSKLNNYYILGISGVTLSSTFNKYTLSYTVKNTLSSNTAITLSLPSGASYTGSSSISLSKGSNTVKLTVKAQTGYTRTYSLSITTSAACTLTVNTGSSSSSGSSSSGSSSSKVSGDVNGDGKLTSKDYVLIKNHILGRSKITDSTQLSAADVNGDGSITSKDYVIVKNTILGR